MTNNGGDYNRSCRNGCGATVTVSQRSGKWAAYEQDGTFHNCPARTTTTTTTKEPQVQQQQQLPAAVEAAPTVTPSRYPQHRVKLIGEGLQELEDHINAGLAANDEAGYVHRGVTLLLPTDKTAACIHYEILQPRSERK